jgi:hypothetical protein
MTDSGKLKRRPRKPAAERKDTDLRIPVTSEQKECIMEAVWLDDSENMAAWIRPILLKAARERIRLAKQDK